MSTLITKLKEDHPQVAVWIDALEESEKPDKPEGSKKLYGYVKSFYHKGKYSPLPNCPSNHKTFIKSLNTVLGYNPDMIQIVFTRKLTGDKSEYDEKIKLTDAEIREEEKPANFFLKGMDELNKKMDELKNTPATKDGNSNPDIIRLQLQYESQIKELRAETEHRLEIDAKNRLIENLEAEVEELKEEVEELENEIRTGEEQLGGLKEELTKKVETESSLAFIGKEMLKQTGIGLLTENTALLSTIFKMPEDKIKEAMQKDAAFAKAINENRNTEKASETSFREIKDRDDMHQKGLNEAIKFLEDLELEEFKVVYTILSFMQTEPGKLDVGKAQQVFEAAKNK